MALWKADGIGCLKKKMMGAYLSKVPFDVVSDWVPHCRFWVSHLLRGLLPKEIGCGFAFFTEFIPTARDPSASRGPGTPLLQLSAPYFLQNLSGMMGPGKGAEGISPINRISANSWEAMVRLFWAQNYSHRR